VHHFKGFALLRNTTIRRKFASTPLHSFGYRYSTNITADEFEEFPCSATESIIWFPTGWLRIEFTTTIEAVIAPPTRRGKGDATTVLAVAAGRAIEV